jgi:FixJ family two-component response regulator
MPAPIVHIVDDDPSIRASLPILLETALIRSQCHVSAEAFLDACRPQQEGCILLDVRMPGMSGTELQAELARRHIDLPIIFLTGYADLPVGVTAMRQGAVDFLTKPVDGELLLERVAAALELDQERRQRNAARQDMALRLTKLTPREREILNLALAGMGNKDIARQLNISLRTIEGHRSRIYLKTGVDSVMELALRAANAGVRLE